MSREEKAQKFISTTGECLKAHGYIAMVDVLIAGGLLSHADYERWRRGEVPYLERVIRGSLPTIGFILRKVAENCRRGGLRPSYTAYMSWQGKKRVPLRFSRSGEPAIERAYATHWLLPKEVPPTVGPPSAAPRAPR